jgi:hypothetical protein
MSPRGVRRKPSAFSYNLGMFLLIAEGCRLEVSILTTIKGGALR